MKKEINADEIIEIQLKLIEQITDIIKSEVKEIEKGNFDDYHIRKINGVKTPVSNSDKKES